MKKKIKFLKMYCKLPEEAKHELVFGYPDNPRSLYVIANEVRCNTRIGDDILNKLGYKDD